MAEPALTPGSSRQARLLAGSQPQLLKTGQMLRSHDSGRPRGVVRETQPDEVPIVPKRAVAHMTVKRSCAHGQHYDRTEGYRLFELNATSERGYILKDCRFRTEVAALPGTVRIFCESGAGESGATGTPIPRVNSPLNNPVETYQICAEKAPFQTPVFHMENLSAGFGGR